VVTGAATGAATGVAAGGAGGVTAGVVLGGVEPVVETRCECFGGLVAFASPIERTALSLVARSIALVSALPTPDKREPEACFDELD